jgi:hypothetical protein
MPEELEKLLQPMAERGERFIMRDLFLVVG